MLVNLNLHKNKLAMKKIIFSALAALAFVGVSSCSSDDNSTPTTTEPNKVIKNIEKIDVVVYEDGDKEEDKTFNLSYAADGKLTSIEYIKRKKGGSIFENSKGDIAYGSNKKVEKITTPKEVILIKDLLVYQNSAYKYGKVLKYDNKKNPSEILAYNKEIEEYVIKITYDDKPFFGFHTLRAAGVIDLLDGVELNLASPSVPAELKMAKELLPNNNPIAYTYTNKDGIVLDDLKITYSYDENNYPTKTVLKGTRQMDFGDYVDGKYVPDWLSNDIEVVTTYSYSK